MCPHALPTDIHSYPHYYPTLPHTHVCPHPVLGTPKLGNSLPHLPQPHYLAGYYPPSSLVIAHYPVTTDHHYPCGPCRTDLSLLFETVCSHRCYWCVVDLQDGLQTTPLYATTFPFITPPPTDGDRTVVYIVLRGWWSCNLAFVTDWRDTCAACLIYYPRYPPSLGPHLHYLLPGSQRCLCITTPVEQTDGLVVFTFDLPTHTPSHPDSPRQTQGGEQTEDTFYHGVVVIVCVFFGQGARSGIGTKQGLETGPIPHTTPVLQERL